MKNRIARLNIQRVVGALRKHGLRAAVCDKRGNRVSGFKVRKIREGVFAVSWCDFEKLGHDYLEKAAEIERMLRVAGLQTRRPFPDKSIVGVYRLAD